MTTNPTLGSPALRLTTLGLYVWALLLLSLGGCKYYSFTGANISPDIKTISIGNFVDRSGGGPPTLSQLFTEKARDYFQRNTSLSGVSSNGDLQIEGSITGYSLTPIAAQASNPNQPDVAAQTRLTITVMVKYANTKDTEANFEQPFSFYADFPQATPLASIQNQLIETISDQIMLDIFNKTVANW